MPAVTTPKKPKRRHKVMPTLAHVRSAITNGSTLLGGNVDHRAAPARRLRDIIAELTSDAGGTTNVSEAEKLLIRRAAMLTLQLEIMEQRFKELEASPKQLETYQRTCNTLRRTLECLGVGLPRRARDVTPPTLEQYAAQVRQRDAAA